MLNGFYNVTLANHPILYWTADIFAWMILPAILLTFAVKNNHLSFEMLGLKLSKYQIPVISIASIVACPLLYYSYSHAYEFAKSAFPVNYFNVDFSYQALIPKEPPLSYLTTLYFSLTAGFVEEILYRSLFFNLFKKTVIQITIFTISSSIIFSLVHWEGGVHNLFPTLVFGFVACILFLLTKSIWPCIIGHCFVDIICFS